MCADTVKFKKIEKESTSGGDEEFNTAFDSIRQAETQNEMGSGGYLIEKTYTITRKTAIIIGVVVLIIVMILFVISAVIGHYTAKNAKGQYGSQNSNFSPWSRWGQCSKTCGIGTKQRSRGCLLDDPYMCDGAPNEIRVCIQEECIDDEWQSWSPWSICKKERSNGVCKRSRDRSCHNTNLNIGGGRCAGKNTEDAICNKEECFGNSWSEWSEWTECNTHCDLGLKTRQRECKDHNGLKTNISLCEGESVNKKWCHNVACKDANECESNPCQNGACVDQYKAYKCVCPMGWKGDNCEILDNCASSPCVYGNCTSHPEGYNCTCVGAIGSRCEILLADCLDIRNAGHETSGVYIVKIKSSHENVKVYCDMETDGGGWTVFQYRYDGSVDFYRNFSDYEYGFGDLNGEFWLGLYYMYHLTLERSELRIDLEAADTSEAYETFQVFSLSAPPYYRLDVGSSSGTISPSSKGLLYNDGEAFSTFDKERTGNNCAEKDRGGWWFDNCAYANLNGHYGTPGSTVGYNGRQEAAMTYRSFKSYESLKSSKMMFRRKV